MSANDVFASRRVAQKDCNQRTKPLHDLKRLRIATAVLFSCLLYLLPDSVQSNRMPGVVDDFENKPVT